MGLITGSEAGYGAANGGLGEVPMVAALQAIIADPALARQHVAAAVVTARAEVAAGSHRRPRLQPGWLYSNTNYILLGMLIQRVTGQSPITEISRRILAPLGLRDTSFPLTSTQIPGRYAHGYYGSLDATNMVNPSAAWTAGAMISTVGEDHRLHQPGRLPAGRHGLQRLQDERAAAGRHRDGRLPARRKAGTGSRVLRPVTSNRDRRLANRGDERIKLTGDRGWLSYPAIQGELIHSSRSADVLAR
jgi:CubicO group peptidase (beta-lactamase class C family)